MKRSIIITTIVLFFIASSAQALDLTLNYQIKGLHGGSLENAQKRLGTAQDELTKPLTKTKIMQFYQQGPKNILDAIQPYGFFKAKIQSKLSKRNEAWLATYSVIPGHKLKITTISVTITGPGKDEHKFKKLLTNFPLKQGKTLKTKKYEKAKQKFYDTAQKLGYMASKFTTSRIEISLKNYTAKIILKFNTGPQFLFGPVQFSKSPFATKFLTRFLPFKEGQKYSTNKLLTFQNNLNNTIYFKKVIINSPLDKTKDHKVPIDVQLIPAKARQYSIGLGYGTDTGARSLLGWEWKRATNTGHYIQTLAQFSQNHDDNAQFRYVIPGKNPVTDSYNIMAGVLINKPGDDNNKYITSQLGANWTSMQNNWQQTIELQYQREDFKVSRIHSTINSLIPSISWEKVKTKNRINTKNGYRIYFITQYGLTDKPNSNFWQGEFQGKYIHSFYKKENRIILRLDAGATMVNDVKRMPLSKRFFAGGSQSIRGYRFQQLGPGKYLLIGSFEYQHKLYKKLYGSVFYDAGNAFNDKTLNLKKSVGIGVVYQSPIGPIQLGVAHAIGEYNKFKKSLKIQFSMGPDL